MKKFFVKNIDVKKYRITCLIKCASGYEYSNAHVKNEVLVNFENLQFHKCKNKNNNNFVDEIENTELAHVFEHLVIDLQAKYTKQNYQSSQEVFYGTTEWLDKNKGLIKVELNYFDDLVALKSIKEAEEFINKIIND